jgi:hypothetical protein
MNDPHIEALYYSVRHAEYVDYDKAGPLSRDTPGFTVRIESGCAEITMISHHATVEAACAEVEPFLRAWELTAALEFGPAEFELAYDRAKIIDRRPAAAQVALQVADAALFTVTTTSAIAHIARSKYPDPPPASIARDAAVELMFDRFCRYCAGRTTLPDTANFCLTALELNAGGRKAAAGRYSVAMPILKKLGELAAKKGGTEARKAGGAGAELTPTERQWLEVTVKRLIRRAAEVAGGPSAPLPQITMACLPPLP